MNIRSIDVP